MINYNELLKPYLCLFSGSENPLAFLDSTLKCVGERGGVFRVGDNLLSFVREAIPNPMHDLTETSLYIKDKFWCCRIMPVKNAAGESDAYICELISFESARTISEKADLASQVLPVFNAVEFNSAKVWDNTDKLRKELREKGDFSSLSKVYEIEAAMANISSVSKNTFEYFNRSYDDQHFTEIDAGALIRWLGGRCNAALAKCGRRIEVITELEDLLIFADSRRAIVALVNAIQNAMLYSPVDTEPILAVYRAKYNGAYFVEIRITNENIMFTSRDFKDKVDINFSYQRLGYGIPIIKRFVQASHGRFSMEEENGKVILTMSLPAVPEKRGPICRLNSPEYVGYTTGTPDLTDILMREVVMFFGEKEELHS